MVQRERRSQAICGCFYRRMVNQISASDCAGLDRCTFPVPCLLQFIQMTPKSACPAPKSPSSAALPVTLSIDIGGSGIKAMLLDRPRQAAQRTPAHSHSRHHPRRAPFCACFDELRARLADFDRVSVGFPGVIKHGITYTAVNLHPMLGQLSSPARARKALAQARSRGQRRRHAGIRRRQGPRCGADPHPGHRHGLGALHRRQALPRPRTRPPSLEEKDLRGLPRPPRP